MPFDHRMKVAEVVGAMVGVAEIDFGDDDRAPMFSFGERATALVVDGRVHPAILGFHERAADDEDVIFTSAGLG